MTFRPWRDAAEDALYGPAGFFRRHAPDEHFRTSVSSSPLFAAAVRGLAERVDDALDRPDPFDVVDVGAGRGELLESLGAVPSRWRLTAVERAPRRSPDVRWTSEVPDVCGLLFANEWLDNVPLDVVEDGRVVEVSPTGAERPGAPAGDEMRVWAQEWWPGSSRVEVGLSRDRAWAAAVRRVSRGLAVAVDYGHLRDARRPTLTGYRGGRQVAPLPDGSCDLTAHVAVDSCAAATGAALLRQAEALRSLGVQDALPSYGSPDQFGRQLQLASQARELLDPAGLGGFWWLVQAVGIPDPLRVPA